MTINPEPRETDRLNGIASITGGDPLRAQQLRANIAIFARRLGDPEMTRMVNEVLAGRRNVREVFRTQQFRDVSSRHLANLERGIEQAPPGTVERLLAAAHERAETEVEDDEQTEADMARTESRLHALRDRDLASSPVGPTGEVEPDEPRRPRRF